MTRKKRARARVRARARSKLKASTNCQPRGKKSYSVPLKPTPWDSPRDRRGRAKDGQGKYKLNGPMQRAASFRKSDGVPAPKGHLHCGCEIDVALADFIHWKTWKVTGPAAATTRGLFVVKNFEKATNLKLGDLYWGNKNERQFEKRKMEKQVLRCLKIFNKMRAEDGEGVLELAATSRKDKISATRQARRAHPQAHTTASDRSNTHDNGQDQLAAPHIYDARPSHSYRTLSQLSTYGIAPQHGSARTQYFLTRDPNAPRPTPTATRTNITARASMRPGHLDNVPIRLPDSGHDQRSIASYIDPYIRRDSPTSVCDQVARSQSKKSCVLVYAILRRTAPEDLRARLASHSFYAKFPVPGHPRVHSIRSSPLSRVVRVEVASKAGPLAVFENSSRVLRRLCVVYLVGFCGLFWPQASLHITGTLRKTTKIASILGIGNPTEIVSLPALTAAPRFLYEGPKKRDTKKAQDPTNTLSQQTVRKKAQDPTNTPSQSRKPRARISRKVVYTPLPLMKPHTVKWRLLSWDSCQDPLVYQSPAIACKLIPPNLLPDSPADIHAVGIPRTIRE
ncbi:hypothetical protein BD779DRAFT_1478214 [Infundibulicybe gibba]|nr:hypothetical protein BD779DRAFT_1478214 [Infundibulicybe gibba]